MTLYKTSPPNASAPYSSIEHLLAVIIKESQEVRTSINDEFSETALRLWSISHCARVIWDQISSIESQNVTFETVLPVDTNSVTAYYPPSEPTYVTDAISQVMAMELVDTISSGSIEFFGDSIFGDFE